MSNTISTTLWMRPPGNSEHIRPWRSPLCVRRGAGNEPAGTFAWPDSHKRDDSLLEPKLARVS